MRITIVTKAAAPNAHPMIAPVDIPSGAAVGEALYGVVCRVSAMT